MKNDLFDALVGFMFISIFAKNGDKLKQISIE